MSFLIDTIEVSLPTLQLHHHTLAVWLLSPSVNNIMKLNPIIPDIPSYLHIERRAFMRCNMQNKLIFHDILLLIISL